jgi:pyrimidine deaminase RibD-like protein/RNA-binding protein YhbY
MGQANNNGIVYLQSKLNHNMPVVDGCNSRRIVLFLLMIRMYKSSSFHWLSRSLSSDIRSFGGLTPISHCQRFFATSNQEEEDDAKYMQMAVDCARQGFSHTFPNPAVGCVLVNTDDRRILGRGYHPRAGYPHAEIFALLEATGLVASGCDAAASVIEHYKSPPSQREEQPSELYQRVVSLTHRYQSPNGTEQLFGNCLEGQSVTAYVTLEPCCHEGKRTPPCTGAILAAQGISRVVVGLRDPNPRVDGGGVALLQERGSIPTAVLSSDACAALVTNFARRITAPVPEYHTYVTGRMRMALRALAAQRLSNDTLATLAWGRSERRDTDPTPEEVARDLELPPAWMEHLDGLLWQHELVLLRLNAAVRKRKAATLLGQRIADPLNAHVAQTKGHTVLLYRPSITPNIDLHALIGDIGDDGNDIEDDDDS